MIHVGKYDHPQNLRKGLYHVMADSLAELRAFAESIGISPEWCEPARGLLPPKLDITSEELPDVIKAGAKVIG